MQSLKKPATASSACATQASPLATASLNLPASDQNERSGIEKILRAFQHQLLVESLVQSFAVCTHYVPREAVRIFDASELPLALERIASSVEKEWQAWLAWTDHQRLWFVVAELEKTPSRDCLDESINLFFYDDHGRIVSSGIWVFHPNATWDLRPS